MTGIAFRNDLLNIFPVEGGSEGQAANSAKSINTYFRHDVNFFKSLIICRSTDAAAKIKDVVSKTNIIEKGFFEKSIVQVCKYITPIYICTPFNKTVRSSRG